MTKFMDKSFSVAVGGDQEYRDRWETTFGQRRESPPLGLVDVVAPTCPPEYIAEVKERQERRAVHNARPACEVCHGDGTVLHQGDDYTCPECEGTGNEDPKWRAGLTPSVDDPRDISLTRARAWCQRLRLGQSDADDESLATMLDEAFHEGIAYADSAQHKAVTAMAERAAPSSCKAESPPTMCDGCGLHPAVYCESCCVIG